MKESEILSNIKTKLNIESLNEIQRAVLDSQNEFKNDLILLSPTGSGKTLAFLIPILKLIKNDTGKLQAVIIAPSRELVIQIEGVVRMISTNIKITICYGGHNVLDEKQSLSVIPSIIVSTPGRLLDHINRKNIDVFSTKYLVLDEFDKSLELGFHDDMQKIIKRMPNLSRQILTSATMISEFPDFIKLQKPSTLNFLSENNELRKRLAVHKVESPDKDKLETLSLLLTNIQENKRCVVFTNHRESATRINDYLLGQNIPCGIYNGGLDQIEREKALEMFNNGSFMVLISTDLGARGLDIKEITHIIHYHLPLSEATYTHRNGRSARIEASGEIHVIVAPDEKIPNYIEFDDTEVLTTDAELKLKAEFTTLYFQAGKKEKISKGDIVGFLINQGALSKDDIGNINSHDHYTLVAVPSGIVPKLLNQILGQKIKNKKVRISIAMQ